MSKYKLIQLTNTSIGAQVANAFLPLGVVTRRINSTCNCDTTFQIANSTADILYINEPGYYKVTYSANLAASAAAVNVVNQKFGGLSFTLDADGNPCVLVPGEEGADPVIKKLGRKVTFNDYVVTFRCEGRGNDVDGLNRYANSSLKLDVTEYDTLYIGSYTLSYDSDHAAIGNEYAKLTCSIDGESASLTKSGTTLDVSNASTVVLNLK